MERLDFVKIDSVIDYTIRQSKLNGVGSASVVTSCVIARKAVILYFSEITCKNNRH